MLGIDVWGVTLLYSLGVGCLGMTFRVRGLGFRVSGLRVLRCLGC